MEKIVRKYGNSLCIVLDTEDREIFKAKEGDVFDVTLKKVRAKEKKE
jgi:hypothetical protein